MKSGTNSIAKVEPGSCGQRQHRPTGGALITLSSESSSCSGIASVTGGVEFREPTDAVDTTVDFAATLLLAPSSRNWTTFCPSVGSPSLPPYPLRGCGQQPKWTPPAPTWHHWPTGRPTATPSDQRPPTRPGDVRRAVPGTATAKSSTILPGSCTAGRHGPIACPARDPDPYARSIRPHA